MKTNCWNKGTLNCKIVYDWYLREDVADMKRCWYYDIESDDEESVVLDSYSLDNRWHEMSYYRFKE
jgi:hypothetical protein